MANFSRFIKVAESKIRSTATGTFLSPSTLLKSLAPTCAIEYSHTPNVLLLKTQYGAGFNGGAIYLATLHLRAMADHAHSSGLSFSVLFSEHAPSYLALITAVRRVAPW